MRSSDVAALARQPERCEHRFDGTGDGELLHRVAARRSERAVIRLLRGLELAFVGEDPSRFAEQGQ